MKISTSLKTVILLTCLILSCKSDDPAPQAYLTATVIDALSSSGIREYWDNNPEALPFIKHDVQVVKITYPSLDLDGNTIEASGAILIPPGVENPPIVSLQHATFFADEEAPSENGSFSVVSRKSIFAANGAIVFLPDYLGYGSSKSHIHPYHHAATLSRHSLDMINAGLDYLRERGLSHETQVSLVGYSEGAYATLALARLLETEQPELQVKGISLGSGGYDLLESFNFFYNQLDSPVGCLPCNGFLIYSYLNIIGNQRLGDYFQQPYLGEIESGLFDGRANSEQIASVMPATMRELFTPQFLERVQSGEESELLNALASNSLHQFLPAAPVLLTHGTEDTVAPYFNSTQYLNRAQNAGRDVTLISLEGVNHFDGILYWGIHTMNWLGR